jgi:SprT-like family protein
MQIIQAAPRRVSVWIWAALVLVACGSGWTAWRGGLPFASAARRPLTPAEARQQELLDLNVDQPGDPDLGARFQRINAEHFSGSISAMPVRWEPALAEVGPLMGPEVTLQGMFGRVGRREVILLNPVVRDDPKALDRALCHEMVHAYLFATGEEHTAHGPAFQVVLQRLAAEHAFEGIAADPETRTALRAWLDTESARLDAERREMDSVDHAMKEEGAALNHQIETFNASADRPAADAQVLDARREQFNQQIAELNQRLGRIRDDLARFNAEVARYNLMVSYPDGLDEAQTVKPKTR